MSYNLTSAARAIGEKIQSKLTEKVNIQVEGYDNEVVYHQLAIVQKVLDHQTFQFLWKLGDAPRMSYQDQAATIRKYLGKRVSISLNDALTGLQVNFKGLITEMRVNDDDGGTKGFTVIGKSASILMDDIPQSQTHIKKSLKDVISADTTDAPEGLISVSEINPVYGETLPYVVQYNETDFQFLQRMAVRYGEWFFYDGERLVFGDTLQFDAKLVSGVNLHNFSISSSLVSQKVAFKGYDYQQADALEKIQPMFQNNTKSQFAQDAIKSAGGLFQRSNKNKHFVAHAGNPQELGKIQELYQQGQEARSVNYSGTSKLPLKIGGLVSIAKDGVESLFLVTKAIHTSDVFGHYECCFESVPYDVKVPHYTNPFMIRTGESQAGKVVENNDPQGMGRVIVEFHWGHKTDWIRMVQPHGGSGKGFYFIPEVGEEVLVGFEGGNVEKPYILGTKYNGQEMSGYGGTANNDLKVIQTRSGTKIRMNGDEGSIFVEDPSGNTWFMDGKGNIEVNAPKNMRITVGENLDISVGKDMTVNVGENITESAGEMISQTASADYMLLASNIINIAKENIDSQSENVIRKAIQEISFNSESGNIVQNAEKQVKNNSGEKGTNY